MLFYGLVDNSPAVLSASAMSSSRFVSLRQLSECRVSLTHRTIRSVSRPALESCSNISCRNGILASTGWMKRADTVTEGHLVAANALGQQKFGLEVNCLEGFKCQKFYDEGENWVRGLYRPETAKNYIQQSNLMETRPLVPDFLRKVHVEVGSATPKDQDSLDS